MNASRVDTVVLCESYDEVASALDVIGAALRAHQHIAIVTFGNADLHELFVHLDRAMRWGARVDFVPLFERAGLSSVLRERAYYRDAVARLTSGIDGAEVFFFTRYMNAPTQLFVMRLARRNAIVFRQVLDFEGLAPLGARLTPAELARVARQKVLFGRGFKFARAPHRLMDYMTNSFLLKHADTWFTPAEDQSLLRDFDFADWSIWGQPPRPVLYFDQPLVQSDRVRAHEFREDMRAIFDVIARHLPEDAVGIKLHPGLHSARENAPYGVELPRFIPAEALYHPDVRMYLSFSSGAITRVRQGTVVSLLDLVRFVDANAKAYIKRRLIERSQVRVLFPQTLDDLDALVRSVAVPHALTPDA